MNRGCFSRGCVQRVVLRKVKTQFGNKRANTEREKELDELSKITNAIKIINHIKKMQRFPLQI